MANSSDYHGIPKPDENKDPWTQDYYDLIDTVDANLLDRNTLANRPASAPDGSLYVVDDLRAPEHGEVYRYNADTGSWEHAVRQFGRVATKDSPVVDVTAFGAVGDGQTNVRDEVMDAVSYAESIAPATVYFPQGRYYFEETVNTKGDLIRIETPGVTLTGAGKFQSVLESHDDTGGGQAFLRWMGSTDQPLEYCGMEALGFENHEGWDSPSIAMQYVRNSYIHNCYATNEFVENDAPGIPIHVGRDEEAINSYNVSVTDCYVVNEDAGGNKTIEMSGVRNGVIGDNYCEMRGTASNGISTVSCDHVAIAGNTVWHHNTSVDQNGPLYQALGCRNIALSGNVAQGGMQNGISLGSGTPERAYDLHNVTLTGNVFLNNAGFGISADSPASDMTITGNLIDGSGGAGIDIHGGQAVVMGNHVKNTGGVGIQNPSNAKCLGFVVTGNHVEKTNDVGVKIHSPGQAGALIACNLFSQIQDSNDNALPCVQVTKDDGGDSIGEFMLGFNMGRWRAGGIDIHQDASTFTVLGNFVGGSGVSYSGTPTDSATIRLNTPKFYNLNTTANFAGAGTQTFTISGAALNSELEVSAQPANDPGNDHGYTVESVYYDTSAGSMAARVSETENAGGGDARITAKVVG